MINILVIIIGVILLFSTVELDRKAENNRHKEKKFAFYVILTIVNLSLGAILFIAGSYFQFIA